MKRCITVILLIAFCFDHAWAGGGKIYAVGSPDNNTRMEVRAGRLAYRVFYAGKEVTDWSPLGFVLNGVGVGEQVVVVGEKRAGHLDKFAWPLGESDTIVNHYQEMDLFCRSGVFDFELIVRVFNGSVAFRYAFLKQAGFDGGLIREEETGFNFTAPYQLYQYHEESVFNPVGIDTFTTACDLPTTLTDGRYYISIGEACNDNYTKAELKRGEAPHSLRVAFLRDSAVHVAGDFQTPWRTFSISSTAIGLHAFSDLFLRLNPPPAGGVPAWIRPGKLIRAQLTTQSGLDCIDFAVRHDFQYILYDAGWYGAEFRGASDPGVVIPAIDLPAVIRHAKEKGIGVILYVNYVGLRRGLDTLLPLYKKWGVSGLKFGFVDGVTQDGLVWLASAIKKVNEYGFILDIHDNYKPTGLSRTYPALLTQEGIRGDENSPDAFHTTVLPFTRFLAGPADFTFCYPNATNSFSKNIRVSKAQQLALTVIYFSPLQSMFWYGKPNDYTDEEDIEFFKQVPTVWNESHYLAGEIGKGISVARRHGSGWFVGSVAGLEDWKASVRLDFLTAGRAYEATIYADDGNGGIRKRSLPVKKGDGFLVDLKAKGGQAMMIEPVEDGGAFVHPGLLQSREDLARMKKGVAEKVQPLYSGYEIFQQNPESHYTYQMKGPLAMVGRNPTVGQAVYDEDANAAYQNAINWAITGERAYADKAIEIINAWSRTLVSITGRDAVLMAGLGPFKMVNAAEIIRYTDAGWSQADIQQTEKHFKEVVYPVLKDFAPFANGNWDAAAIKTVLSIGVFCNDRDLFERALRYYVDGGGNGCITHYIINEEGQVQESGRDQQHTQLGIGLLGDCSEIAWHQGLNLYGYANNRLLRGFEYTARYNLGNTVPFVPDLDRTGKYAHAGISAQGAGQLRAVYEQIYNHYVHRMGMAAPYTEQAAEKVRPEGPGKPGADHPGYGTLFYSRDAAALGTAGAGGAVGAGGVGDVVVGELAAPGALTAVGAVGSVRLSWVGSVGAERYTVKRAVVSGGPYVVVSGNVKGTEYTDTNLRSGIVYYYTVSASNAQGESVNAYETGISAGLPALWKQEDAGHTDFDGKVFRVETGERKEVVETEVTGDGVLTVRFLPQPSSQFTTMGLTMRSLTDSNAAVGLLLSPGKSGSAEAPVWMVQMKKDEPGIALAEPIVTYGRLTGYCWLRLERKGGHFIGYVSADGERWTLVGSTDAELGKQLLAGVSVASGMAGLGTTVFFDRLTVTGWNKK